jgi:hypothetical protein
MKPAPNVAERQHQAVISAHRKEFPNVLKKRLGSLAALVGVLAEPLSLVEGASTCCVSVANYKSGPEFRRFLRF